MIDWFDIAISLSIHRKTLISMSHSHMISCTMSLRICRQLLKVTADNSSSDSFELQHVTGRENQICRNRCYQILNTSNFKTRLNNWNNETNYNTLLAIIIKYTYLRFHLLHFDLQFPCEKCVAPCALKISKAPAATKVIYIHFHGF